MASSFEETQRFATCLPAAAEARAESYHRVYEENRRRLYALAFWMTDNEMEAEELMAHTFCRAFAGSASPSGESLDRAFLTELRERMPVGTLSLECAPATEVKNVRRNTLRVHLERAVVQVPATERLIFLMHDVEGYEHARIARTLGLSEDESRQGLHQARLRLRQLLAGMQE